MINSNSPPYYTIDDLTEKGQRNENPGEHPYTRGIYPLGYRAHLWNRQQFAGYGTPEQANQRYKYLQSKGQESLFGRKAVNIAFDLPTIYGLDSDDERSEGEVGRCGVAIDSIKDFEILFDSFPLEETFTSMVITGPAIVLLGMYIAYSEKKGVPINKLSGVMQNDPLKAYIASRFYIFPPNHAMRIISDILEFCTMNMPKWNTIGISGYHMREAGCTAVQELAFTAANGMAYLEAGIRRGLEIDEFAPRFSFYFSIHNNFFEEIAKLRAARRIWARIVKERYKAQSNRSCQMRFHLQTGGSTLTAQQPENNIIRTTIQALAGVLGGTQGLHTNSMDEALGIPTEKAVTIALNTQNILIHESGVIDVVDPLGGSYYLEKLTDQIEEKALAYLKQIEQFGSGMLDSVIAGIEKGFFLKEIADSAAKFQDEIMSEERVIVGVNKFVTQDDPQIEIFQCDPAVKRKQMDRIHQLRRDRNNKMVQDALRKVKSIAEHDENLIPPIINSAKAGATLGEIVRELKAVFGTYNESIHL